MPRWRIVEKRITVATFEVDTPNDDPIAAVRATQDLVPQTVEPADDEYIVFNLDKPGMPIHLS